MLLNPVAPAESILYRYLTEGFGLPNEVRLEYLANMVDTVQAAAEEMRETGEAAGVLPDLEVLAQAIEAARKGRLEEIQGEYTRLFVAGMNGAPCRLVEAVQRENALMGEVTEEAASMYLRFGLEVKEREPDHLTAELEFCAYLAGTPVAEGKDAERYRRARIKFVTEHLRQWCPGLTAGIRKHTEEKLYLALADLLDWLMEAESAQRV